MKEKITSRENENIKKARRIMSEKKYREETGKFLTEGVRLCEEAGKSGRVDEAYFTAEAIEKYGERLKKILETANTVREVSREVIEKISDTKNPQGIVCVCKKLDNFDYLDKINSNGKYIVMAGVSDPGNAGTIIRTADALGVSGIIMTEDCVDIYSPKTVRATMGSIFHITIVQIGDDEELLKFLKSSGIKSYAATLSDDSSDISKVKFENGSAVLIGNEANGLSGFLSENSDFRIKINMKGEAESLNAASAAAIITYCLMR